MVDDKGYSREMMGSIQQCGVKIGDLTMVDEGFKHQTYMVISLTKGGIIRIEFRILRVYHQLLHSENHPLNH